MRHETLDTLYDTKGRSRIIPAQIDIFDYRVGLSSIKPLQRGTVHDLHLVPDPHVGFHLQDDKRRQILQNSLRLEYGPQETPVYIVDDHQQALYAWYEALALGQIVPGATLVHYDAHSDAAIPSIDNQVISSGALQSGDWTPKEAFELSTQFACWEFIEPAQRGGLIGNFVHVTPSSTSKEQRHLRTNLTIEGEEVSFASYAQQQRHLPPSEKIVDIDIDFFVSHHYDHTLEERVISHMRQDIETAGVVTFATSPGFIDQHLAVDFIKKILR